MLKVENLNKYYNRGKSNEIHVINNTSFTLSDKGLVTILGSSGSGKTTLLNSLCGIDSVDSGKIYIDDHVIEKYSSTRLDDLRSKYFGYVFQNYNLIGDQTVFENVAFSLRMIGIKDETEIQKRTIKALSIVQMEKYKGRFAKNLSGGQQQRVSIARAIVKDSKYILADEPTGNLDRKNTIIVMSILKEIAKTRLVVMVTHERELAYAYADRIMEIKDGEIISDYNNQNLDLANGYVYKDENLIYLGDLEKEKLLDTNGIELNRYSYQEKGNLKIDFVVKDKQIFIRSLSPDYQVRIIDDNSLMKFSEGKSEEITTPLINSEEVKVDAIDYSKVKGHYRVNLGKIFITSIAKLFKMKFIKRAMLLGFLISSFLLTMSVGLYRGISNINEEEFMQSNRDVLTVAIERLDLGEAMEKFTSIVQSEEVYGVSFYSSTQPEITTELYISQMGAWQIKLSAFVQNINDFPDIPNELSKLESNSVLIDQKIVDSLLNDYSYYFQTVKTITNQTMIINDKEYQIAGIVNYDNFSIYANDNVVNELRLEQITYENYLIIPNEKVLDGNVMVSNSLKITDQEKYQLGQKIKIGDVDYLISGYFDSDVDSFSLNKRACETYLFNVRFKQMHELGLPQTNFIILSRDYEKTIKTFEDRNVSFVSQYDNEKTEVENIKLIISSVVLVITAFAFIAPLIMLYFLMRSNTIEKSKEIGIYRALGLRNQNIITMYFGEILSVATIYAIPGFLMAMLFMFSIDTGMIVVFKPDLLTVIISIVLIFVIIIFVGLLPVLRLIKRTPQKIMTKYDI